MNQVYKKKGELGVSLVELMVALGIGTLIIFFIMNVTLNQQKNLNSVSSKYERTGVVQEIREILADRLSCKATLEGRDPNNTPMGTIQRIIRVRGQIDDSTNGEATNPLLSDITVFVANPNESQAQSYGNGKVKFLGFSLNTTSLVNLPANAVGISELTIDTVLPESTIRRRFPQFLRINVENDNAGNIIECGVGTVLGLSLASMCSTLGGQFDPYGRGGVGSCYSLRLTGDLRVNGDLGVYSPPSSGLGGQLLMPDTVALTSSFHKLSGSGITASIFCSTLGGTFITGGRGGVGDCQGMSIEGGITVGGTLLVTGSMNFLATPLPPGPPAGVTAGGTRAEEICQTLGGVYNPLGRNGSGDCQNINSTTNMNVSGDILSSQPLTVQ